MSSPYNSFLVEITFGQDSCPDFQPGQGRGMVLRSIQNWAESRRNVINDRLVYLAEKGDVLIGPFALRTATVSFSYPNPVVLLTAKFRAVLPCTDSDEASELLEKFILYEHEGTMDFRVLNVLEELADV